MARQFLMGNEAFAHAALAAGCGLFAGYPGTPSSEVIETVARLRDAGQAEGVYVEWSTNEKAALEVAAAASLSGVRAMVTCKQVGLNVASDALMSLNYVGVKGGLVILVADDPGPISSQTEQDTRRFAAFAKVPVFDPATPEQGAAMLPYAFEISERYSTPVIFRPTTRIDHASTFFDFPDVTEARPAIGGGFNRNPAEFVIFPPRAYQAHGEINERLHSIAHDWMYEPDLLPFNPLFTNTLPNGELAPGIGKRASLRQETDREQAPAPATLGIVTGGVSTQYAREAIRILDRLAARSGNRLPPLRLLQIGTPYPFPRRVAQRALKDLTDVLVLEELDSVIEEDLQKMANASFLWPRVHGKLSGEANTRGENSTEDAVERIGAFLEKYASVSAGGDKGTDLMSPSAEYSSDSTAPSAEGDIRSVPLSPPAVTSSYVYPGELPKRPAVLCAGCPHRASFLAVKRALKQLGVKRSDAVFAGDIGCYTLGNAMPLDAVDTCLCMGGGITMAQGIAATNADKKAIAFVGDSTFFASGMTGIVNATYNNHDITLCVLDNATTAMTGLQPHPGTGLTLMGEERKPVNIEAVLRAANVQKIVEVDPLMTMMAEDAAVEALEFDGPSAIIFRSPCVWSKPFGVPAKVNTSKCTGCKKCITQVGCPAIGFELGVRGAKSGKRGQAVIDRTQCNGCGLCIPVCPVDAISQTVEIEPEPVRQSRLNRDARVADIGEPVDERLREEEPNGDADFVAEADPMAHGNRTTVAEVDRPQGGGLRPRASAASDGAARLASERLSGIRSDAPIIPMSPYAPADEFEDDDLYEAMTAQQRREWAESHRPERRVIKPEGKRRYFMKDSVQRSAAAAVFAYTPLGEASQAAQIALTANERRSAARAKRAAVAESASYTPPDYGGNSELSLDALFSDDSASEETPLVDADGDEVELSFDGVQLDWDDEAPAPHRSHGRSTDRNLRRVTEGAEGTSQIAPEEEPSAPSSGPRTTVAEVSPTAHGPRTTVAEVSPTAHGPRTTVAEVDRPQGGGLRPRASAAPPDDDTPPGPQGSLIPMNKGGRR